MNETVTAWLVGGLLILALILVVVLAARRRPPEGPPGPNEDFDEIKARGDAQAEIDKDRNGPF